MMPDVIEALAVVRDAAQTAETRIQLADGEVDATLWLPPEERMGTFTTLRDVQIARRAVRIWREGVHTRPRVNSWVRSRRRTDDTIILG